MAAIAIYPGSFDPVTNGHVDVIRRGSALFDELIVAIGHNPDKPGGMFSVDERIALLSACCGDLPNIRVVHFSGLMVHAARAEGATVILRGLRALADFDLEFRNGLANRDLSGLETLFILTAPHNLFVSSSLVKEIATHGGDVSRYVPVTVDRAIRGKLGGA